MDERTSPTPCRYYVALDRGSVRAFQGTSDRRGPPTTPEDDGHYTLRRLLLQKRVCASATPY